MTMFEIPLTIRLILYQKTALKQKESLSLEVVWNNYHHYLILQNIPI